MIYDRDGMNTLFKIVYIAGIAFGFVECTAIILEIPFFVNFVGTNWFIGVSAGYIIVLASIGGRISVMDARSKVETVGTKVQTAGYLYTLIGVIIALLQINDDAFTVQQAMRPIGAALLTSLIGWFAGSLIYEGNPITGGHAGKSGFSADDFVTFKNVVDQLEKRIIALNVVIENATSTFDTSMKDFKSSVTESSNAFKKLRTQADDFATGMEGVTAMSRTLSKKGLSSEAEALVKNFKDINKELEKSKGYSEFMSKHMSHLQTLIDAHVNLIKEMEKLKQL